MKTVLLVDDEVGLLSVLSGLLTARGYVVVASTNGTDAMAKIRDQPFDAVVCDVVMEGKVGTALLEEIRATPGCEAMPVVFMSCMPEGRVRRIIEGDYNFLHKPFTADQIVSAIETASVPCYPPSAAMHRSAIAHSPGHPLGR